jgi:hypothetical protein
LVTEILMSSVQSTFYSTIYCLPYPVRMCEIIYERLWKDYMIVDCESQVFHWHQPAYFCHVLGQNICSAVVFIPPCDRDYRLQLLQEK